MNKKFSFKNILFISLLISCSNKGILSKQNLDLHPDEFKIQTNNKLVMPDNLTSPLPLPKTQNVKHVEASKLDLSNTSKEEKFLLEKTNKYNSEKNIRTKISSDSKKKRFRKNN